MGSLIISIFAYSDAERKRGDHAWDEGNILGEQAPQHPLSFTNIVLQFHWIHFQTTETFQQSAL